MLKTHSLGAGWETLPHTRMRTGRESLSYLPRPGLPLTPGWSLQSQGDRVPSLPPALRPAQRLTWLLLGGLLDLDALQLCQAGRLCRDRTAAEGLPPGAGRMRCAPSPRLRNPGRGLCRVKIAKSDREPPHGGGGRCTDPFNIPNLTQGQHEANTQAPTGGRGGAPRAVG